jgi:uncharacterized caspase-like protein
MKRLYTISLFLFISLLPFPSLGFSERGLIIYEQRLALVIGNSAYRNVPLRNPVNDANDMTAALKELGFKVIHLENADQRKMEYAIRQFGKHLRKVGVGLFYFAGHGIQVNGCNYLIPIGADMEKETEIKYEAVEANRVLDEMYEANNGLNIVILDACRQNPYARSFRTTTQGLARMVAPTGTLIAYATAPGSIAADGTGRNGLYTSKLLKYMITPGLKVEEVFKKVRIEVVKESVKLGKKQVPWEASSLMGDFYFVPRKLTAVEANPLTKLQVPNGETGSAKERERIDLDHQKLEREEAEIEKINEKIAYIPKLQKYTMMKQRKIALFPSGRRIWEP